MINLKLTSNVPNMGIIRLVLGACSTNCYIVYHKQTKECIIIDPADSAEQIIYEINQKNLLPKYIFITHGHTDHILAMSDLLKKYQLKVLISKIDAWRLQDETLINERPYVTTPYKAVTADIFLEEGDIISLNDLAFEVMIIPGHTEGSAALKIGNVLFTGDTLQKGRHGKTTLTGGNKFKLIKSLHRLKSLKGNYIILAGHREPTTLDNERCVEFDETLR